MLLPFLLQLKPQHIHHTTHKPPAIVRHVEAPQPVVVPAPVETPPPVPEPAPAPPEPFINTYAWGNCTWFVANNVHVPQNLGNANTWGPMAEADGYTVSDVPAVGSVAWTTAGYLGHVALVAGVGDGQVYIHEMNAVGLGVDSFAWYPTSYFRYIYF